MRLTYGDAVRARLGTVPRGIAAAFATGWMQLFQVVFAPREIGAAILDPGRDLRGQSRDQAVIVNRGADDP